MMSGVGAPSGQDYGASVTVDICVCTYKRPALKNTILSLLSQHAPGLKPRIVVADNDVEPTARELVNKLSDGSPTPILYLHAPSRNISIARNACLDAADADWLAFIDDDETAPPNWIADLHAAAVRDANDIVFGPVHAVYPDDTPGWIRQDDYHSTRAPKQNGEVKTGHAGNVLIRWGDEPWREERFLLSKGRTGGEDVEFFFRMSRMGLRLGACDQATAYEPVPADRLTYQWIRRRRFLAGQFHGAHSRPPGLAILHRARLLAGSGLKIAYCGVRALAQIWSPAAGRRWIIRGGFHAGVCAGALSLAEAEQY